MPLTTGNVTIKLSAGTYSSWASFWDDLGNLTGDVTCTVDASAFTESSCPSAVTETLGGYTLHVLPASFPTTTDGSTGARFTCNYTGECLDMEMEGAGTVIIEGIVLMEGTSAPLIGIYTVGISTDFTFIIRRNILKGLAVGINISDKDVEGLQIYNNIIYAGASFGIQWNFALTNFILANNTIVGQDVGIYFGNVVSTSENNLIYGSDTADFQYIVNAEGNNNADGDGTGEDADWGGGGANNVSSIADPFNNLAGDDFTITVEGVVGTAGKDLSGTFTTDFFGVTRVNWTIGACEYLSVPSSTPSVQGDYTYNLDGSLILEPGQFVATYTTLDTTAAFIFSFLWEEIERS